MSMVQWADERKDRELVIRFRRFVAGSLAIHVVAIAFIGVFSYFQFRPQFSDTVMIVNFRGRPGHKAKGDAGPRPPDPRPAAAPSPPAPKPEPKPAKPEPKPEATPEPKPEPKPVAKEVSPDKSKTDPKQAKPDPKKTEPKPQPKPEPEPQPEAAPPPLPPGASEDIALARSMINKGKGGAGEGTGGGGDWEGVEGYEGDEALGFYHTDEFATIIQDTWRLTPDLALRVDLAVDVEIKVDNKGKVLEGKIVRRSESGDLDRTVLALIEDLKKMDDIPPPPVPSREGYYLLRYRLRPGEEV